jgi:hypothetical protein
MFQKHFTSIRKRLGVARRFLKYIIDLHELHHCPPAFADGGRDDIFTPLQEGVCKNQEASTPWKRWGRLNAEGEGSQNDGGTNLPGAVIFF